MNWKITAGIITGTILLIGSLLFVIKVQYDSINRLKVIESSIIESKKLQDEIMRSQSSFATAKDLETIIKQQDMNIKTIKEDLAKFDAKIKGVNTVNVVSSGKKETNVASSSTTPQNTNITEDKYSYLNNGQKLKLDEPFSDKINVPIGNVEFSAWKQNPWSINIYPRQYSTTTVLGLDSDGRHYAYSKSQITVNGKSYTLPITDAKLVEEFPSPSFTFNPRLYLSLNGGVLINPPQLETIPNLYLSLFSYGQTKINPTWSFLGIGLGYEINKRNPTFILSPVNYNVAKHLPLVDNLYVGPTVSVDTNRNIGITFGLSAAL